MASYEKYWIERADRRIADRHKYLDASILQIQDAYNEAMKELNSEIDRLFLRLIKDTGLSRSEVMKLLKEEISSRELEEIRSRIDSIEDEDILRQLRQKLEVSYYKNRISRQEALREAIHIQMSVIADRELSASTGAYTDVIREEYYHNIFDSQQFLGFAFNFVDLPDKVIEQILADDWSGKHYSKRIWGNSQTMAGMIEKIILKGAMKGTNSRKMAQELNKISNAGMYACERLIRTETTYFTAMADLEAAKARGTEKVQFVATLDARTSEECRASDGKIILVSEAKPGRNIPPLHPFCRSVIIDVIEGLVHKVRRARDPETGKNVLVPANMTYRQWKDLGKSGIISLSDDEVKVLNDYIGFQSYIVNEKLRTGEPLTESEEEFVNKLDSVLDKLPKYEGALTRSLEFYSEEDVIEFVFKHEKDVPICYNQYVSATRGEEFYNPNGQVQLIIDNTRYGVDLTVYNAAEEEILYKRDAVFVTKDMIEQDGIYYIFLEEYND